MMIESGAFIWTKFIGFFPEIQTGDPQTWGEHLTTVLPRRSIFISNPPLNNNF